MSEIDDIKRKVQARVAQEEAADKGQEEPEANQVRTVKITDILNGGEQFCGLVFADMFEGRFIFNATSDEWLEWQGHHWKRDTTGRARASVEDVVIWLLKQIHVAAYQISEATEAEDKKLVAFYQRIQSEIFKQVKRLRSEHGRSSTLSFASNNKYNRIVIESERLDRDPMLLGCANCVIDLRTGEGRPGRPEDNILLASPIEFLGIDHPAPTWDRFLKDVTLSMVEMENYHRRLAGYFTTGDISEHIFPVFYGDGRNGKGTEVETIKYVMGPLASVLQPEMLLDQGRIRNSAGPSPDIMALKGLRLALASESDDGRKFSASAVKRFTGGDSLTGRNPHDKHPITFTPTHKIVLICNDKPRAPANDYAFWRRMHLVPFNAVFVDHDPQNPNEFPMDKALPEKLKAEASGILAWMIRGCLEWQKRGLDPPAMVRDATAKYQAEEDLIGEWLSANCIVHDEAWGGAKDLFNNFSEWWLENISNTPISQKRFGTILGKRFERVPDRLVWYRGIGLLTNWKDQAPTGPSGGRPMGTTADDAPFGI